MDLLLGELEAADGQQWWCYSGVTVVLQWCYSGVTKVSQWCYSGVPMDLLLCEQEAADGNTHTHTHTHTYLFLCELEAADGQHRLLRGGVKPAIVCSVSVLLACCGGGATVVLQWC
jgi:hypothetical protein